MQEERKDGRWCRGEHSQHMQEERKDGRWCRGEHSQHMQEERKDGRWCRGEHSQHMQEENRDECQVNNGGCEHSCKNTVGSFMCCCSPGYRLRRDGRTCQDVNECEFHNGGCSHECANTVGSYRSLCGPGSRLMPDGRTCVASPSCATRRRPNMACRLAGEASCGVRNGGCDHYCDDTAGRPKCSCRPGYILGQDGRRCEAADPCVVDNGGCQHICL
ncbi:multiple epidermal growth factor-like domains protein 6 isoform X9 [Scylla paramamosain]